MVFKDSPALLSALKNDPQWSSQVFVISDSHKNTGDKGFNAKDWIWFADLLVESALIEPNIIVPQIASLVVLVQPLASFTGNRFQFFGKVAFDLFGHRNHEFLRLMQKEVTPPCATRTSIHLMTFFHAAIDNIKEKRIEPWEDFSVDI